MAPYVIFHIDKYLSAIIALFTDKNLIIAASLRIENGVLIEQVFYRFFHDLFWVNHAVKGVRIC